MGYIETIRQLVGHEPIILTSAGAIILDENGKILLEYRKDTGDWGIPGGYMEPGETFEETLRRELQEEMAIHVTEFTLYHVFSGKNFYHEYPNGDRVYSVIALYTTDCFTGEIHADDTEVEKTAFFALERLPDELTSTTRYILDHLKNKRTSDSLFCQSS